MKTPAISCLLRVLPLLAALLLPVTLPAAEPPPAALLTADSDGDSQPDVAEHFSGTNPGLSADYVKLDSVRRLTGPDRFELSWPSVGGRTYNVLQSTGLGDWSQVTSVTASGLRTTLTVPVPAAGSRVFFRITAPYHSPTAPFLVSFTADRASPLTTAALVRLTLKAYHPDGIAAVDIKNGANVIGRAAARGSSEFVFDWQADGRNNGAHSFTAVMITGNGVTRTTSALPFTVNVTTPRQHFTVCDGVEVSANNVTTVGFTRTFSGNVQIGQFTMTGNTTVTLDLNTQILTGSGPLIGPGGLQITFSPWSFDAARCVLSLTDAAPPSPLSLIPGYLTLTQQVSPLELEAVTVNYGVSPLTGFRSSGSLSGSFPGRTPVNVINASGKYESVGYSLQLLCSQSASFGSGITADAGSVVIMHGVVVPPILPLDYDFPLSTLLPMAVNGRLHFPTGTGGPAVDIDGLLEVKLPVTTLDPSLPPLVQGTLLATGLPVIGSVDPDGSFRPAALPPQPQWLLDHLDNFVPLGPDCLPMEGGRVIADALGNLPPCEWRPVIPCAGGGRATFSLRFPNGLRYVKDGAQNLLKFLHLKLASAPDCPMQLAEEYAIHASAEVTLEMDGSITVEDLLGVLNLNVNAGIHVRFFGKFDAVIKSGRFTPKGLAGAVLDMAGGILDLLPDPGDSFLDAVLDFQCPDIIEIPCRWPSSLPGPPGGGGPILFEPGSGCRVRMDANGGLCVYGLAKINLVSGGPSFHAEINACGDSICMEVLAEDLDLSLSASWTLPVAETIDAAVAATRPNLDPIARTLLAKLCAFERSAVSFLRWLDANYPQDPGPRPDYDMIFRRQAKAAMESFANARIAVPSLTTPAELEAFIRQAARSARTAPTFDALIEVWMALERLKASGITSSAGSVLANARAEVRTAITDALNAGADIPVGAANRAAQFIAERAALLAQAGQSEDDAGLATRTGRIIDRAASLLADDLNVVAGQNDTAQNPTIRGLSAEEVWAYLQPLHDMFATAAAHSIPVSPAARKTELLNQLGRTLEPLLAAAFDAARLARDPAAYEEALYRYAWMSQGISRGTLPTIVMTVAFGPLAGAVTLIAVDAYSRTGGSLAPEDYIALARNDAARCRRLAETAGLLPAGVTLPAASVASFVTAVQSRLSAAVALAPGLTVDQLRFLLEAGTESARLRDVMGLGDGTVTWESAQRLSVIIDRLVTLANTQFDIAMLDTLKQAGMLLLEEAARFDAMTVPNQVKRKFCLLEAEKLTFELRDLAVLLRGRVTAASTLKWVSGVRVDHAAAGFCYDIPSRLFTGWASGSLALPGFGSTFTLKRLTFDNAGNAAVEVDCTGLPGFPSFAVGTSLSLTGTISPGGIWSLTGTAGAVLQKPAGLPWNINIQTNSTVTINNSGVHIGISGITGGATASGTLDVTSAGVATFTGTLSLDPISVGVMSLTGTGPGGKLVITVGGGTTGTISGATFSAGAPFNRSVGVAPITIGSSYAFPPITATLPATTAGPFTFGASWNWNVQVSTAPSIVITAGATAVGAMSGVTTVSTPIGGGTISTNGSFALDGTLTADLVKPPNLPWNIMLATGTDYTLTPNSAVFTVTADGASLVQAAGTVSASWSGSPPSATVAFHGLLTLDTSILTTGIHTIIPAAAGATRVGISVSGTATGSMSGTKLRLNGPFDGHEVPLPALVVDTSYNFGAVTPAAGPGAMARYVLEDFQLTVARTADSIVVSNVFFNLPGTGGLPDLAFTGSIGSDGSLALTRTGGATLFGFGASGTFSFNAPAQNYQALLATPGFAPAAWWRLDETSGTTAIDATGRGYTGTHAGSPLLNLPGAGWPPAGRSYSFNGTSARVSVADHNNLEGGSAMTVSAWFKVNTFDRSWQTVVSKGDNAWRIARSGSLNTISFDTNHTGGSQLLAGVTPVNDGKWHHVVGVWDGSRKYLYLDGQLENSAPMTTDINANTHPVMIGENAQTTGRFWNGGIDEVVFWRRGLSSAEVRDLYASALGARLSFSGSVTVPGFTTAAFSVNGTVSHDSAFTLSGTMPQLNTGNFSLTAASGDLTLTIGSGGISIPAARLRLGDLFLPLDLPPFTVPLDGNFTAPFTPAELDLRGFKFPAPALTFRRSGSTTSLDTPFPSTLQIPAAPSPLPVPFPNISITNAAPNFSLLNSTLAFPGWNVTGNISLAAPPQNAQARMTALAPQGYWALDETLTILPPADGTGNGHNGQRVGGVLINQAPALYPALGKSYLFNGTDAAVTIPDHNSLEGGSAMSVTAWIRTSAFTRDWQAIVTKGDSAWRISRYSNTSQLSFDTTSGGGHHSLPGTSNVADGKWHHVAAVYDGVFKSLYVDGRLEARAAYTSVIDSNAHPVMIGENAQATGRFWNGGIDEVAFFRRGLSAAEVRELHAAGNGLRLFFTGTAALPGITPSVSGSITSGGGFDFATSAVSSHTIFSYAFSNASFLFRRDENATETFTGSLRLNALPTFGAFAPLSGTPTFTAVFTKENATNPPLINIRTKATLTADNITPTLCGYTPAAGFDLSLTGFLDPFVAPLTPPKLTFADFRFANFPDIGDIGFPALQGRIEPTGAMRVTHAGATALGASTFFTDNLNLRNMLAAVADITFDHNGLNVIGAFNILVTAPVAHDFGDIAFSGRINPNGNFTLNGSGRLNLGTPSVPYYTNTFSMVFRSADQGTWSIAPASGIVPRLEFAPTVNIDLPGLGLHQNGYGGLNGQASGDTGWRTRYSIFDAPFNTNVSVLEDRFEWNFNTTFDIANHRVNASMNANAKWSWRYKSDDPLTARLEGGPPVPNGFNSSGSFSVGGSIGTNGLFTFDPPGNIPPWNPSWAFNTFDFDLF